MTAIVWSLTFMTTLATWPLMTSLVKLGWTSFSAGGSTVPVDTLTSGSLASIASGCSDGAVMPVT